MPAYEDVLEQIEQLEDDTWEQYSEELDETLENLYQFANGEINEKSVDIDGVDALDVTKQPETLGALKAQLLYSEMQNGIHTADTSTGFADYVRSFHDEVQHPAYRSSPEEEVEELVETVFSTVLEEYKDQ